MDVDNVRTHYSHQAKDQLIDLYLAKIDIMEKYIKDLEEQVKTITNLKFNK